jgi:hypothetical protein
MNDAGAPVILVGTHLDAKKCTKKYLDHLYANLLQKFSGQFKNIRFFFALSCATGKGVEDLRKKLIEVAQSMIEKEGLIPQAYLTLEEKVPASPLCHPPSFPAPSLPPFLTNHWPLDACRYVRSRCWNRSQL